MKKRVTGIGGIFFRAENPEKVRDWYAKHLGIEGDQYGACFAWESKDKEKKGTCYTAWSPMDAKTKYLDPSQKQFMFNYRVENLVELLEVLKKEGVTIVGGPESFEYGKFAWIMDLEGNKVELWEPIDKELKPSKELY